LTWTPFDDVVYKSDGEIGFGIVTLRILRSQKGNPPAERSEPGIPEQLGVLLLVLAGVFIWVSAICSAVSSAFSAASIRTIAMLE